MKKNIKENKILFCIIIAVMFIAIAKIIGVIFKGTEESVFIDFLKEAIFAVSAYILLKWSGKKDTLKRKTHGFGKGLIVGGFLTVISGLSILGFFLNEDNMKNMTLGENIIFFSLEMILVGIAEEFVFRGAIQNTLYDYFGKGTRKGIYKSIIFTGLIFGIMHIANIISGASISGSVVQAINAFAVGCYFSAIYYRSDNIWSVVVLHAMLDFNGLKEEVLLGQGSTIDTISSYGTIGGAIIFNVALYLGLTVFILRKSKLQIQEDK